MGRVYLWQTGSLGSYLENLQVSNDQKGKETLLAFIIFSWWSLIILITYVLRVLLECVCLSTADLAKTLTFE